MILFCWMTELTVATILKSDVSLWEILLSLYGHWQHRLDYYIIKRLKLLAFILTSYKIFDTCFQIKDLLFMFMH